MNMKHIEFARNVAEYVRKNPDSAVEIMSAMNEGIRSAVLEARQRAGDMEAALSIALDKKLGTNEAIIQKLRAWDGRTALEWGHVIEKLDK